MKHKRTDKKSTISVFLQGFATGLLGLGTFYFLLLFAITGDLNHPLSQFSFFQPWMSLLIVGFGIQMGLFWMMRNGIRFNLQDKKDSNMTAGTSTAVSGMAMAACCAHHAVDLLPILGLSVRRRTSISPFSRKPETVDTNP